MRSTHALLAAATAALVGAAGLVGPAAPAHAGDLAVPVDCRSDSVTLSGDDMTYELSGPCGLVRVTASNATVRMPTATKLVVRGDHNEVHARPVQDLRVLGHDQTVHVRSVKDARLSSPGSRVRIASLLENARVPGNHLHLRADQISRLLVGGNRNSVTTGRGWTARIGGDHNRVHWRRLDQLGVPGNRNELHVRRGATETSVSGTGNRVDVNRRG